MKVDFNKAVKELKRSLIVQALKLTGGNRSQAARFLNLNRTTLLEKMGKLGLMEKVNEEMSDNPRELKWKKLKDSIIQQALWVCEEYSYPSSDEPLCLMIDDALNNAKKSFDEEFDELKKNESEDIEKMRRLCNEVVELRKENAAEKKLTQAYRAQVSKEIKEKERLHEQWVVKWQAALDLLDPRNEEIAELKKENEELKKISPSGKMALTIGSLKDENETLVGLLRDIAPSWLPENVRNRRREILKEVGPKEG